MRGKAKISDNWSSGFQIEIEDEGNLSKFVNQFNDNPDNGSLNVRKSAIYIENKQLGKVWLGQQETAKDNITKDTVVIKGLDQTMHADFYMNWSFFLRQKGFDTANAFSSSTPRFQDIGRCYSTSSSAFDCSTRRQEDSVRHARMVGLHRQRSVGRGRRLVGVSALPEGVGQLEDRRRLRL